MIEIDCLSKTPDFFFVVEFIRDHLSLCSYVSVSSNPNLCLFPDKSSLFGNSCLYFYLSFKRLFICKCEFMWISVCPPLLPSAYSFYNRVSLTWGAHTFLDNLEDSKPQQYSCFHHFPSMLRGIHGCPPCYIDSGIWILVLMCRGSPANQLAWRVGSP